MSSTLAPSPPPVSDHGRHGSLSDIVRNYAEEPTQTTWLTQLNLQSPRENLRCLPATTRIIKRIVDLIVASILLVATCPVILVAMLLIKLSSPGNAIFSQTRVGLNLRKKKSNDRRAQSCGPPSGSADRRDIASDRREANAFGRPFTMYKLRTMRNNAEEYGAQFAQHDDPRVTRVGKFLRRTRIDELPQLWNVLKGDMSMVGPRPERPEFMETLSDEIPNYLDRLGLKPGITGIAQVVNGYDNELEGFRRKVSYDLLYLQNSCLLNDLKILLRTVRTVITGDGAV